MCGATHRNIDCVHEALCGSGDVIDLVAARVAERLSAGTPVHDHARPLTIRFNPAACHEIDHDQAARLKKRNDRGTVRL